MNEFMQHLPKTILLDGYLKGHNWCDCGEYRWLK